jgi:hypothetical protein
MPADNGMAVREEGAELKPEEVPLGNGWLVV